MLIFEDESDLSFQFLYFLLSLSWFSAYGLMIIYDSFLWYYRSYFKKCYIIIQWYNSSLLHHTDDSALIAHKK